MDCSPPGSSVLWILQARMLEWVAISSTRWSSPPRDQTLVSCISCIDRTILYPDTKTVGHNSFLNFQLHVRRGWPAFSVNSQMANVLSFTGHTVPVGITQLFHCSLKAATMCEWSKSFIVFSGNCIHRERQQLHFTWGPQLAGPWDKPKPVHFWTQFKNFWLFLVGNFNHIKKVGISV